MKVWNSHRAQSAQHPYGGYIGICGRGLREQSTPKNRYETKMSFIILWI